MPAAVSCSCAAESSGVILQTGCRQFGDTPAASSCSTASSSPLVAALYRRCFFASLPTDMPGGSRQRDWPGELLGSSRQLGRPSWRLPGLALDERRARSGTRTASAAWNLLGELATVLPRATAVSHLDMPSFRGRCHCCNRAITSESDRRPVASYLVCDASRVRERRIRSIERAVAQDLRE